MTTNTNDGKNQQLVGRLSPFIEPRHSVTSLGLDSEGMPYANYNVTVPEMQEGDNYIRTLIDIRNRTVIHVAALGRPRTDGSGSFVMYVYTRNGMLIHRVRASDEIVGSEMRRLTAAVSKAVIDSERPNLDFDGDDRITPNRVLTPELIYEATNLRDGQTYRITPAQLDELLETGEAPTASRVFAAVKPTGDAFTANLADMETAQRLCKTVVIDEVNYGRLAVSHIGGIPFVGDVDDLAELCLPAIYLSRTPKFNKDIKVLVEWTIGQQTNCCPFYALEKEDINELCLLLSKRGAKVIANFMSVNLKVWENGVVEQEYTSPETYFTCNEDWIERAKF